MRGKYWLILIGIFIMVIWIGESLKPRQLDWRPTYDIYHKIPFGTHILFNEIDKLFPGSEVDILESDLHVLGNDITHNISNSMDSIRNYLYINNANTFTSRDIRGLLTLAEHGNHIFLSSNFFPEELSEKLDYATEIDFYESFQNPITDTVFVCNKTSGELIATAVKGKSKRNYFHKFNRLTSEELGTDASHRTNFISVQYGLGKLYIHLFPEAFTNYNFIKHNNLDYINEAICYLPNRNTYYDYHYIKPQKIDSMLDIAQANKSMNSLIYLLISLIILYIFFSGKRRQNAIPIIKPIINQTKAFVETISALYQSYDNPRDIAIKKIKFFQELIYDKYHINLLIDNFSHHPRIKEIFEFNDQAYQTFLIYCNLPFNKKDFSQRDLILLNQKIEEYKIKFRL